MIPLDRLIEQQKMRVECRCTALDSEELKHFENDILEALKELKCCREDIKNRQRCDNYGLLNKHIERASKVMRHATEEEMKYANDYIKSISKPTGVNIAEYIGEENEK